MSTIGSLNVNLGMSTAAFSTGAKKATATTKSLASSISSAASIVPGLGTAIAGIGAALSAGALAAGFQSMVSGSLAAIDATGDLAGRIGVSVESLTRLQHAAKLTGSDAEALAPALGKMNANLGKAKDGSELSKTLEAIGLNAEQLKQLDPAEAFVQIATGIGQIPTQADKSAAALAVFGKGGEGLINTFNAGGDSLHALMEESDRLGNTISNVDAAKVGAANDSLDKMWAVLTGIGNDITIELAPFIEAAANKLVEFGTEGNRMGEVVSVGFEYVGKSIAIAADTFDLLVLGFKGAQYLITKGLAFQSELWLGIGKGVAWVAKQLGQDVDIGFLEAINQELHRTADQIGTEFQDKLIGPSSGEKVTALFDSIRSGAQAAAEATAAAANENKGLADSFDDTTDSVAKLIAKYQEQVKFFDVEGRDAEIGKLKDEVGNDPRIAQLESLNATLKQKEADKKNLGDAAQLRDSLQSPLQKFQAEMKRIASLTAQNPDDLKRGLLSGDEAELAKLAAQKDFASSQTQEQANGAARPAALERGTAAAFSASFGPMAKPIDKVAKLAAEQLIVQKRIEEKTATTYAIGA